MTRKNLCLALALAMLISLLPVTAISALAAERSGIISAEGWLESAGVCWSPVEGAEGYRVYVASSGSDSWTKIDNSLIRQYEGYWRADAVGLKAGSYRLRVVPVANGAENSSAALVTDDLTVLSHDRSGFAFVNGSSSGAYNNDGTLKNNAVVVYVNDTNKDSVTVTIDGTEYTGLANILSSRTIKKATVPICVRFIGNITDPAAGDGFDKGDILISEGKNITLEGIGEDAVLNGFGIRLKRCSNIEIRNLGLMNCDSDEGDNVGLQQENDHIWVHNCDFLYGDAGSDADQEKGDGALDTKKSSYVTHSYNHFFDCGKVNLQGNSGEESTNYITYHHNWYDHTDSRHPRVRTATVHVYNNLYDGISKYGIGAAEGCSIFSEANYFLNSKKPFLISSQGCDTDGTLSGEDGGIIKSFGDVFVNSTKPISYATNNTSFDAYFASARDEKLSSSVVALKGGSSYNNFDTNPSLMYDYEPESAEEAMETVKKYAGRMNGGDFKWSFTDADNTSYAVNSALKAALKAYRGSVLSIGGLAGDTDVTTGGTGSDNNPGGDNPGGNNPGGDNPGGDNPGEDNPGGGLPVGSYIHNVTESGLSGSFFSLSGSLSDSKGTVSYAGLTLTQCLKLNSKASVSFTAPADGSVTLVFNKSNAGNSLRINGGDDLDIPSDGIFTLEVKAGTAYKVLKGGGESFLYYLSYTPTVTHTHEYEPVGDSATCAEDGELTYVCSCGDSYTEPSTAKGHSFSEGSCTVCGAADPDHNPGGDNPGGDNPGGDNPGGDNPGNNDEEHDEGMNCSPPSFWDILVDFFKSIGDFFARLFGIKK